MTADDAPRIERVIISSEMRRGAGVQGDPIRAVYRLFMLDGTLLAEWDSWDVEENRWTNAGTASGPGLQRLMRGQS